MNTVKVNGIETLINYDFKHGNTDVDYENAISNIHKERQLKDIVTDTFIEEMFSDSRLDNSSADEASKSKNAQRENNRFNFLAYVYTYMNLKVKLELPRMLSEQNIIMKPGEDVYLMFKGGNMMYYKYEDLKKSVKPILQDQFFKLFDENFKISDFDFTCYITVKDSERFYKVKKAVNQILWRETIKIRNFFETYMNVALDNTDSKLSSPKPIDENESDESKKQRIQNVVGRLFEGVTILQPADNAILVNKAMQLNETINFDKILDFQQVHSTLYHLRSLLYREVFYHKSPNKLSAEFDYQYKKESSELKTVIVDMWKTMSDYIVNTGIKSNDHTRFMEIVKNNHIPSLLIMHEIMVYVRRFKNNIFDNNVTDNLLIQQANDMYKFLETFIEHFTLIFERRLVESDFYNSNVISNLLRNVKDKFEEKKGTLSVCEAIYDEYQSFDGDTSKLKAVENFNFLQMQGKVLDVYMEKRNDFYIQPSLLSNSTTYEDTTSSNFHYVYQNSTIKKHRNQSSSVVDFDLLRVKFGVNLQIGNDKNVKVPSEFIDISICNFDDSALTEFRNHTKEGLGLFTISNGDLTLECFGYSIEFMVHDLVHVLYEQNLFTPWADAKYHKRIKRLNALQMLSYVGKEDTMRLYLLSVLVVYIIITYSQVYVASDQGKIATNNDMDRLFNNARDNIDRNFDKYNLEKVFNILPTSMLDVICRTYLPEYKDLTIPYPDQIIGSVIFYSILQNLFKQNQGKVKNIINRYRHDFSFLPADDEDIDKTMKDSLMYVNQMESTFIEMLELVKQQVQSGGDEQTIEIPMKVKRDFTFF